MQCEMFIFVVAVIIQITLYRQSFRILTGRHVQSNIGRASSLAFETRTRERKIGEGEHFRGQRPDSLGYIGDLLLPDRTFVADVGHLHH